MTKIIRFSDNKGGEAAVWTKAKIEFDLSPGGDHFLHVHGSSLYIDSDSTATAVLGPETFLLFEPIRVEDAHAS